MVKDTREGELPWDPLWAYVLGEEEEEDVKSRHSSRHALPWKKRDIDPDDSAPGIMSYILPSYEENPDNSCASDQSVEQELESREQSENSTVGLVAGLFSWRAEHREGLEKGARKNRRLDLTTLTRAKSELSEKSGDSAKISLKSDDSKGRRSLSARSGNRP